MVAVVASLVAGALADVTDAAAATEPVNAPAEALAKASKPGKPPKPKLVGNRVVKPDPEKLHADHDVPTPPKRGVPKASAKAEDRFVVPFSVPVSVEPMATPEEAGWTAPELQQAYSLPSSQLGQGKKIAVVTAYDAPNIHSDLATYRDAFGLPTCTTADGCFTVVGQDGSSTLPSSTDDDWAAEATLDLQMISAICPNCSLVLVEANSNSLTDMLAAVDTAKTMGVDAVNMSWGAPEWEGETSFDHHFDDPDVEFFAATGDSGTGPTNWPAASTDVLSVGGTDLYQVDPATNGGRLWYEEAWEDATGGCSPYEAAPSYQEGTTCESGKAMADLSAVAGTAVAIYFTPSGGSASSSGAEPQSHIGFVTGWQGVGGTSASAPQVAGAYLLSMDPKVWAAGPGGTYYPTAYRSGAFSVNDITECGGPCAAWQFWDPRTGLGSMFGPPVRPNAPAIREKYNQNRADAGPRKCERGNPVLCSTGNNTERFVDFEIPGRGHHLRFERTYNAMVAADEAAPGPLGWGWTHAYASWLFEDAITGEVIVFQADGTIVEFTPDGSGGYAAAGWILADLTKNADGTWTFTLPDHTVDTFDSGGRLVSQIDRNGEVTTLAYDASDRLAAVTDPAGRSLTVSYDANDRIAKITDPLGRDVIFAYDGSGHLTSATDAAGNVWGFTYDSSHRMTSKTDPDGGITTNVYDTDDRVVEQTDPLGRTTTWAYDTAAKTTTVTDPEGRVTVQTYNEYHQLISAKKAVGTPDEATWLYSYEPGTGQLANQTDPNGNTTAYEWDDRGNLLSETDPLGRTTTYTYDDNNNNNRTSMTDPSGITTTYTYTANHNLASESTPVGSQTATTSYEYDPGHPGDLIKRTDPRGKVWRMAYDTAGNLIEEQDPLGNTATHEYDTAGRRTATVSPRGNEPGASPAGFRTTFTYDPLDRLLTTTDPLGNTTTNTYDGRGNQTSTTDSKGNTTTFIFDAAGQLLEEQRPDGTTWTYVYDNAGNRTSVTDGAGKTRTYTHDNLDRLVSVTDTAGRTTSYTYDPAGNRLTETLADGKITTSTYDAANQLTSITYSDGTPGVSYTYDANGRRKTMADGIGTTTYTYDALSRVTRVVNGHNRAVDYAYDLAGNVTSLTYAGITVTRGFDDAGQLTSVNDGLGNTTAFGYDADGNLIATDYPNGVVATATFDGNSRQTAITHKRGSTTLGDFSYTRDALGFVDTGNEALPATTVNRNYTYTQVDQLASVNGNTYGYDSAGNLTAAASGATLQYDSADQLTKLTQPVVGGASTVTTFTYDARGNRTSASSGATTTQYTWDQANRLTNVGSAVSYRYNGDGLRMEKRVPGLSLRFLWDATSDLPLLLSDVNNAYVYGPGGKVLEQIDLTGLAPTFLHTDQLGSTRLLTDPSGQVAAGFTYDPFGNPRDVSGSAVTPFGFAGEYTDPDTGFIYLRARSYDPATGQFLSRDPIEDLTQAPYSYAGNNPANLVDPTGLCGWRDPWNCADDAWDATGGRVVSWAKRNRHTIIDVATAGAGATAFTLFCAGTAGTGCAVALGGVALGGAGAHLGSDAVFKDQHNMSMKGAVWHSMVSTGAGAVCGWTFGQGCAGATLGRNAPGGAREGVPLLLRWMYRTERATNAGRAISGTVFGYVQAGKLFLLDGCF